MEHIKSQNSLELELQMVVSHHCVQRPGTGFSAKTVGINPTLFLRQSLTECNAN